MPLVPRGSTSSSASSDHGPLPSRTYAASCALSERCVATGSPSARQASYSSGVHVYGACGETPSRTVAGSVPSRRSRIGSKRSATDSAPPNTSR